MFLLKPDIGPHVIPIPTSKVPLIKLKEQIKMIVRAHFLRGLVTGKNGICCNAYRMRQNTEFRSLRHTVGGLVATKDRKSGNLQ
jgi:hypothetical protein